MKILYIHQYFKTPEEPGGTRSYWIARELLKNNHEVVMLTSRNDQINKVERINIDGISVIYLRNSYDNSFSIVKRLISFLRFMWYSYRVALNEENVDIIYATSTPLTVGIPALLLKKKRKIPYIFEVRDLWPEVPIQMGALKDPFTKYLAIKLEKTIYKNSRHIIALSPGMKKGIVEKCVDEDKVSMIPNMAKIDQFYLRDKNAGLLLRLKLNPNNFYVLHFGTIGLANGVEYIIDTAKILKKKGDNKIVFLFAGGGGLEPSLREECKKFDLHNVHFLGAFNMNDIAEIVNFSDCSIIPFADISILRTNSPNKLFDSLSAQKPIIVNSAGWTKEMVEENHCGAYVNPKQPNELADLLLKWSTPTFKPELDKMGLNARKLAEQRFDKSILTKEVCSIINGILN